MLCVRVVDDRKIVRVSDTIAHRLVREERAAYVAKHYWKEEVRDFKPEPPPKPKPEKKPKKQKGGKSEKRRDRLEKRKGKVGKPSNKD